MPGCLTFLNPGRWLTVFAAWWLRIDYKTAEQLRGHDSKNKLPITSAARVAPAAEMTSPAVNGSSQASTSHTNHAGYKEAETALQLIVNSSCTSKADHCNHNDVESSSSQDGAWGDAIRDKLLDWDFNVFDLQQHTQNHPLVTITLTLLEKYELLDGWKISRKKIEKFLVRVEGEYKPNSYHNNTHAADVTQTAVVILESFRKQIKEISKTETFCVIIASAVHDLGHLGVNNDFLINSKHPRATTYNDKSINENYHISRAFEIARESADLNIFDGFTFDEQKQIRKLMIDMVLATDMAIHFDLLNRFTTQIDSTPDISQWTERSLLYQMLVHLADIANPSRPFHIARGWAERVIEEFIDQGDKEAKAGLAVSPMCNRTNMNMPRAQLGFVNIFLKPTLNAFEKAAPQFVHMALEHLEQTIKEWTALEASGLILPSHLMPKQQ